MATGPVTLAPEVSTFSPFHNDSVRAAGPATEPPEGSSWTRVFTHMPDGEKDERRREQQSQHVAEGRECERHSSAVASVRSGLSRLTMCWGSLVTVSRIVGSGTAASSASANHVVCNLWVCITALCWRSTAIRTRHRRFVFFFYIQQLFLFNICIYM